MQRSPAGLHGARLDGEMEADPRLLLRAQRHRSCGSAPTASHPGGETPGNKPEANGCSVRPGVNHVTLQEHGCIL